MAKGNSNGLMRGKLGNKVMYAVTNSNNKEQQGERAYIANIANPKSVQQAVQRMKLAPAVNFYRAFKQEVLNHSWQGVKYGGRSHAYFMKQVLASKDAIYPFVPKGTTQLIPGQFPVSRGSLTPITIIQLIQYGSSLKYSLDLSISVNDENNILFSDWILASIEISKGILNYGDQVTLVACIQSSDGSFYPMVKRLVLDSSKYPAGATAQEVFQYSGIWWFDSQIGFAGVDGFLDVNIAAAAVIISRPQVSKTSGSVTWLRSSADMFVDPAIIARYNSQDAYDAAIRSYLGSDASVSSEWYLNDGVYNSEAARIPVAPGITSGIQLSLNQVSASPFFGRFVASSVNVPARSNRIIATVTESDTERSLQLYSLIPGGINPGEGTPDTTGLTVLRPVLANPDTLQAPFDEDYWSTLMNYIGNYITPEQAIAEQAAIGNTYTLGEYQA